MYGQLVWIDQYFVFGFEWKVFDVGNVGGYQIFGGWEENGQEVFDDEVVEFLFQFVQVFWCLWCWNDCEVVVDFGVVEDLFVW